MSAVRWTPPMTPDNARVNFSAARVAVIESSKFSIQIVRSMLFGFGFREILEFDNVAMAKARLKVLPVDLILCNPYPDLQGNFKALSELRDPRFGETAFAAIIAMTGSVSLELMHAAREARVDCVLAKPFSASALLDRIVWAAKRPGMREPLPPPQAVLASAEIGVIEIW